MDLTINGKKQTLAEKMTILEFILQKDKNPESFVIEYNGQIVERGTWGEIEIKENDCLEVLRFVGGG